MKPNEEALAASQSSERGSVVAATTLRQAMLIVEAAGRALLAAP